MLYRIVLLTWVCAFFLGPVAWTAVPEKRPLPARESFLRGNEEVERGDYQAAEAFYRECLRQNPGDLDARHNLGNCLFLQEKTEEAEKEFEVLVGQDPKNAGAHNGLGLCYMREKRFEEAIECFGRALGADPTFDAAERNVKEAMRLMLTLYPEGPPMDPTLGPLERLETLIEKDRLVEAYSEVTTVDAKTRRAAEALAKLGIKCLHGGYVREAATLAGLIRQCEDGEKLADFIDGASKRLEERYDEAVPLLERSVQVCPDDLSPAIELGLAYEGRNGQGDRDKARVCYLNAEKLAPQDPRPQVLLGYLEIERRQWSQARARFEKALSLNGDLIYAWLGLGQVHYELDAFKEAERCLRKALDLNPGFPEAKLNLGVTLWELGDRKQALELVEGTARCENQAVRVRALETANAMRSHVSE